jgi:hypothetical protein
MTPIERVLRALEVLGCDPKPCGSNKWMAKCPAHDDHNPSLSITVTSDGKVLLHCHGKSKCKFEVIVAKLGLQERDLFPPKSGPGAKPAASSRPAEAAQRPAKSYASQQAAIEALSRRFRCSPSYTKAYRNADKRVVGLHARWYLPKGKECRMIVPAQDGGWIIAGMPPPRPLADLPELLAADPSRPVFVPEGEPKVDALVRCGLIATTSSNGARAAAKTDWTPLRGRYVVILPDNDEAGEEYASDVARLCHAAGAASIKIVRLRDYAPELPEGGDIADVLESENWCGLPLGDSASPAELGQWLEETAATVAPWQPSTAVAVLDGRNVPWLHAELAQQPGQDGSQLDDQAIEAQPPAELAQLDAEVPGQCHANNTEQDGSDEAKPELPMIFIGRDEYRVNDQALAHLQAVPNLFVRDNRLVRIADHRITLLTEATLREELTRCCRFVMRKQRDGNTVTIDAPPPTWCTKAILDRGEWPGIRKLRTALTHPVMLADGRILNQEGFDADSGIYLTKTCPLRLPENPSTQDIAAAKATLLDLIQDFPFVSDAGKTAWLAALLTPLVRHVFAEAVPAFVIDGNRPGCGKTLLASLIHEIVCGEPPELATLGKDEDEQRKQLSSILLCGRPIVIFDNLPGRLGGEVFNAFVTATRWADRMLGRNELLELPNYATIICTGNNVRVLDDSARRIIAIRLETDLEKPENRSGFRYPDLFSHVRQNRGRLLGAALTLMRAYVLAGRPNPGLKPFGSFQAWSSLVRGTLVWAGLSDPLDANQDIADRLDPEALNLDGLLDLLQEMDPQQKGFTAEQLVSAAGFRESRPEDLAWPAECRQRLRDILAEALGHPTPVNLGRWLARHERRNFGGRMLVGKIKQGCKRWSVSECHPGGVGGLQVDLANRKST